MGDIDQEKPYVLYRVELRELVAKALRNKGLKNVFTAFNWPLETKVLPAIWITSPADQAKSNGAGPPDFNRTASIVMKVQVSEEVPDAAQKHVDYLIGQIEQTLMTDHDLLAAVSEVEFMQEENRLTADAAPYIAEGRIVIGLAYQETFPLNGTDVIQTFGVTEK
ncbi:hypothetical protein FAI40_01655 [Acetobacteraceae bacterium]|nr:hypothetical protein FAI40_01655 [Acetobacteraceae bacterium]